MRESKPTYNEERISKSELVCDDIADRVIYKLDGYDFKLPGIDRDTLRDVSQDMFIISSYADKEKARLLKMRDVVLDIVYRWIDAHVKAGNLNEPSVNDKTSRYSELATQVLKDIHKKLK